MNGSLNEVTEAEAGPAIVLEGVSKSFGPRTVLADVSFSVTAGTTFVLLGRSGTGKSVLLKLICGLLKADAGTVTVGGTDMTKVKSTELGNARKHMGFLFQSGALFDSLSVGENVAFSIRRHTDLADRDVRERVRGILASVGLEKEYATMPAEMSGGMRKRVGLARALAMEPSILLIDEPSAGLDPITSLEIDALLIDIRTNRKATLIVVTHNVPSARRIGDHIALLDGGRLVAQGTVDEMEASELPIVQSFLRPARRI
jgi:phospholipid/cholesterol/gamma-HCH transport system ATP-binding protein